MPILIPFIIAAGAFTGAGIVGVSSGFFLSLIGMGVSMTLSGVVGLFTKHPSATTTATSINLGSSTVTVRQALAPRVTQYGEDRRGGVITFLDLTGPNGQFLQMVITLSGHQLQSIDNMYFDNVLVPLDINGNGTGKYAGFVHVEKKLGGPGEAAFAGLIAADPTKWTVNHRQDGCGSVYIKLTWSQTLFPSGIPNITFDIHGKQVFDPRTGLTAYSNNAALCVADYLIATKPNANAITSSLGLGDLPANIDSASTIASANNCDEAVLKADSTTENRYACNGSFTSDQIPRDVIPGLLSAMAGNAVYAEGVWKIYSAMYRPSGLPAFTDSDLMDKIKYQPLISRRDLSNSVKGTYRGPLTSWQADDFPPVINTPAVASDGESIWLDLQLPFTSSPSMAQRLAKIQLQRIRYQGTCTFAGKLTVYQAEVCEAVQVTHSRFNWLAKNFEVADSKLKASQDANGHPVIGCDLSLRETDPSVYSWNAATEETPVVAAVTTTLPDPTNVAPCSTLAISESPVGVPAVGGASVLRVLVAFTPPADQYVLDGGYIWIERRDHSDMVWRFAGKVAGNETQYFDPNIFTGHTYDYRVKAEGAIGGVFSADLEVDNLTINGNQIILMSAAHAQQGSIRPSTVPVWTLVTNTNNGSGGCTQRYTCPATTIPLSDGTSLTWPATDVTWTGLAGAITYIRAPRFKIADGTVHWATGTGINTDADPNTTPLTSAATQGQRDQMSINQSFDGYFAGSNGFLAATTPNNSGTGGGSAGGGGICIWEEEHVVVNGVIIPLGDTRIGDIIKGRVLANGHQVYRRIIGWSREYCADWYLVNGRRMTPCEQVNIEGKWMRAFEAPGAEQLFGVPGYKINIRLDAAAYDDQNFVIVALDGTETIVHNFISQS